MLPTGAQASPLHTSCSPWVDTPVCDARPVLCDGRQTYGYLPERRALLSVQSSFSVPYRGYYRRLGLA